MKYNFNVKRQRANESEDFRCKNCKMEVAGQAIGTRQRNQCPYCLYSLHVDESIGDRKSTCKSLMKPVGLTMKKDGEVMIVHECSSCGKVSANRIAGDDDPNKVMELVDRKVDEKTLQNLKQCGISLVRDRGEVETQLFGKRK